VTAWWRLQYNPAEAARKSYQLDTFFRNLHKKHGFNGTVLIAQYGKVLYKGAFGYADLARKDTLTEATSFQLASVSKQFTAVAVMKLKEMGKLRYDDDVKKYLPDFPYEGVTVRQLLCHRSGLPNYMYFCDDYIKDRKDVHQQRARDSTAGPAQTQSVLYAQPPVHVQQHGLLPAGVHHRKSVRQAVPAVHGGAGVQAAGHDPHPDLHR
jgi:CubicO group peptidase (beta-lactamase class C family)